MVQDSFQIADLRDDLRNMIEDLVETHPGNFDEAGYRYFDAPLVGFASASDDLFTEYKRIIGPFHWTPSQALEQVTGPDGPRAGTVVCWVLPITGRTRLSNARQERHPSLEWARTRNFGEKFNDKVRMAVTDFITTRGGHAIAPMLFDRWTRVRDPEAGIASNWSERHAAYAAGLGTFSLNRGFITPLGMAHRCGSVVTDIVIEPTRRPYKDHRENCLTCRGLQCGECIKRCPCGAITLTGQDKDKCDKYYRRALGALRKEYGVSITGCGLCQTGVPCENSIP
jgi:epoxyqueuosine reductase QueG